MSAVAKAAKEIFLAALDKSEPANREAFLAEACGTDAALRRRVVSLLQAHDEPDSLLDQSRIDARLPAELAQDIPRTLELSPLEKPGTQIGPYKLMEQLGEGGMGLVFVAEQQHPVRRKVALKVIKPGLDTRAVVARFEAERQALAIMDHPNIARVLDGGETASGRPYFVMELVKGLPITQYSDEGRLTPRARLELFVDVCQAVQHAHQKGIIHRDIKPSNVLVMSHDGTPVVKVIDFGVAKAIGQQLTEKTIYTQLTQLIGTPLYMSPEQAGQSGLDVDTRSDIYSLGVLLYELLTGTTPFDKERLKGASYEEMRRIIREEEPPKPSTRVSTLGEASTTLSANRQSDPKRLSRLFRGELDWIVMKALEKDRNRRYETASAFAADVERYLHDEPVQACPPSAAYRLRKFVRRNKSALSVAGLVLCFVLVVGSGIGWTLRARAERQTRVSAKVALILDEVERLERQQKWPEALSAARQAEAALAGGEAGQATRARIRQALSDLEMVARLDKIRLKRSEIHGQFDNKFDIFDHVGAVTAYAQAFRDYGVDLERLPKDEAVYRLKRQPRIVLPLAAAIDEFSLARRLAFGKSDPGCMALIAVARGLDPDPMRDQLRATLGRRLTPALQAELRRLAESIDVTGQPSATLALLARTLHAARLRDSELSLLRRAQERDPDDFWINFYLGFSLDASKDYTESVRFSSIAVALHPSASPAHNNLGATLRDLKRLDEAEACLRRAIELDPKHAAAYINLGNVLGDQRRLEEAEACYRRAIELDPMDAKPHSNLGGLLHSQKKLPEAEAACRRAIELAPNLAAGHCNLGAVLNDQHKLVDAEVHIRRALELDSTLAVAHDGLGELLRQKKKLVEAEASCRRALELDSGLARAHFHLGDVLKDQQKLDEAEACYRRGIELDPNYATGHNNLGLVLHGQKKLDEAEVSLRRAIDLDPNCAAPHSNLGNVLRDQKNLDEAEASYRRAIELDPNLAVAHGNLGAVLNDQNRLEEAEACYRRAIELDPMDAKPHSNLGGLLHSQKKLPEAEAACRRATELDPNLVSAWLRLGQVLRGQQKLNEAEACCRRGVELDPNSAFGHKVLGVVLMDQGKFEEAETCHRRTIAIDPHQTEAHYNLGVALEGQKKLDEAVASYRRANELDPDYAPVYDGLRSVLWKQQEFAESLASCEKLLALEPQNAGAHNSLAWCLATCPAEGLRDAPRAIELAARAIELDARAKGVRNTLGVAHYRTGHWMAAIEELSRSLEELGGNATDGFFLAMAYWQLDQKDVAHTWYDKSVAWMEKNDKENEELIRFRAEAEELMDLESTKD